MLNEEYYTKDEAIAYAVIALKTIQSSANDVTIKELSEEIPIIMKLHTPKEAVERANRNLSEFESRNK